MPIYDFRCKCGHTEEGLQKQEAPNPKHCNEPMERVISAPCRFIFKGEGFYATEYGKQAYGLNAAQRKTRSNRELKERGLSTI